MALGLSAPRGIRASGAACRLSCPMTPLASVRRTLRPHPQTPCAWVEALGVEIEVQERRTLAIRYRVAGDTARLRIPDARLDSERLWAHTCFELFMAPVAAERYLEHNFSPTGQSAQFAFASYRRRTASAFAGGRARPRVEPMALWLEARVPIPVDLGDVVRLSPTAVLEDTAGTLSYWAMRHPGDRPDFHDRRGFVLALTLGPSPSIVDATAESP